MMRTRRLLGGVLAMAMLVSACAQDNEPAEVDVIYTNAALTLASQLQTLQAGVQSTPADMGSLMSPTSMYTPQPSPTLSGQVIATSTTSLSGGGACDNSVYLSDVTITDGTAVTPGQSFTKTWKVSNSGSCAWTAAYQIIFISGDGMSGKATAIGKAVKPGEFAEISLALVAPAKTGNVTGTWRLSNEKGQTFGTTLTVVVKVGSVTGTSSVTPTKTTTGTVTPTPSITSAATPSSTSTMTLPPTDTVTPTTPAP